jgi:Flp pilus assembly pilin Flp
MKAKPWTSLMRDSRGATMVEYIVIVALILIVALEAWTRLGKNVQTKTDAAADALEIE